MITHIRGCGRLPLKAFALLVRSSKPIFDVTRYQKRIFLRFRLHFVAKIF